MKSSSSSSRLLAVLSLSLSLCACASDDRQSDDDKLGQTPSAVSESEPSERAAAADASLGDASSYYPCSTYAANFRTEADARELADAWPGRLLCVLSVNEEGVGVRWSVSYGSDCKCHTPLVESLPAVAEADAGT